MSLKDIWTDKIDGFDVVEARHINEIAHSVMKNEEDIVELKKSKIELASDLSGNEEDKVPSVKAVNEGLDKLGGRIARNDKRLTNIEQGIPPELFETDSSVAYTKEIPEKALPYAEISKIGGMTYKDSQTLKSAKVSSVESVGVNLWDEEWEVGQLDVDSGGTLTGTTRIRSKNYIPLDSETTYRFSYDNNGNVFCCYDENHNFIGTKYQWNKSFTTLPNTKYVRFMLHPDYGAQYKNDIMLNLGSTALPYHPYFRNTLPIPKEVQALDGYGWGVNKSVYNYIDFEKKKFVKRVGVVDLGTLPWTYNSIALMGQCDISSIAPTTRNLLLSNGAYDYFVLSGTASDPNMTFYVFNKILFLKNTDYTTAEAYKTAMAGVMLYYELAEPIVTDISDILPADNFIEVEGGGTITAVNENGFDVPSEITYMLEEETV